jgi:hypothetical protein
MTTETETQTTETTTADAGVTPDQAKDALYGKEDTTDDVQEQETPEEVKDEETKTEESGDKAEEKTEDDDKSKSQDDEKSDDTDKPYELKFDETINVDDSVKADLEAFGKENGIEPDKLSEVVKKVADRQNEAIQDSIKAWMDESLSDKEFGGDAYEANIQIAAKPLQKYGTEKFVELLEQTGLNSNPEVIRTFYRIGKAMSEGESIDTTKAKSEPDILTKLYGPSTGSN